MSSESSAADAGQATILDTFKFERVLSEDTRTLTVYLLGTAIPSSSNERCTAIVKVEKTPYDAAELETLATRSTWAKLQVVLDNDIYSTILGWYAPTARQSADVQISGICPATEKHIKKYSQQVSRIVRETPSLYQEVVEPYMASVPASSTSWVYNILDGKSEAENVIFRDDDPDTGFVLTPDLKWDQKTMSSLYLQVLVQTRQIRSLRDLRPKHLDLLRNIRAASERAAADKYGLDKGELRFFVHYQPTYYHFHVHVVHVSYLGFSGITVGQAHLLDDLIDDLELEEARGDAFERGYVPYFVSRTFTYALGVEHPLYGLITKHEELLAAKTSD